MKEINIIKPIELTFEQKGELIHLCTNIWPNIEFWWSGDCWVFLTFRKEISSFITEIHWFEFVIRMALDEDNDDFLNFYLNVCSPDETPNDK